MPESGIIPVDFRQPKEPAYEDSCGACVIAGGLLELAGQLPKEEQEMYVRAAEKILRTIAEKRADFGKNCDAIVQNCTASYGSPQTHITMVYADYFFVEALYKLEAQRRGKNAPDVVEGARQIERWREITISQRLIFIPPWSPVPPAQTAGTLPGAGAFGLQPPESAVLCTGRRFPHEPGK